MNGLDNLYCINNIPNLDIQSKLTDIPNLKDFDLEENLIHSIQSDYHPLHSLNSFVKEHIITKSLALYHVNINSLDKHIDELRTVLAYPNINWDIIAISETGEQPHGFKRNIDLDGFNVCKQTSKSRKGGVGLYINNKIDHFKRDDLKVQTVEFETVWVELINKHKKNILCCCAYRHPDSDPMTFIEHFEKIFTKLSEEKKPLFILGDFNFDLLSCNSDFLNSFTSSGLLPTILQPTRLTCSSATVIDNIFTNYFDYELLGGNLLLNISDHLSQFLLLNKLSVDMKSCTYYEVMHILSQFDELKFINDFDTMDWSNIHDDKTDLDKNFDDFHAKVSYCVEQNTSLKKVSKR